MRKQWSLLLVMVWVISLLAACGTPEATDTPEPGPPQAEPTTEGTAAPTAAPTTAVEANPLYLSIIWHQHQPLYFKDPETGIYQKPWVRLHAAKDYVDMAAVLEQYPDVHATFNLTPSLLRQLQDLEDGAKDLYQVYTEVSADQLTDEQKAFVQERFFDTNSKIIARFPLPGDCQRPGQLGELGHPDLVGPSGTLQPGLDRPRLAGPGATRRPGGERTGLCRGRQGHRVGRACKTGGRGDPASQEATGCGADRGHHDPILPSHPAPHPGQQPGGQGRARHQAALPVHLRF